MEGSLKEVLDKAIAFNNTGVSCLRASQPQVAWDLFKGALEVKLAIERSSDAGTTSDSNLSETYVRRAEYHLSRIQQYVSQSTELYERATTRKHPPPMEAIREAFYEPYLCATPFRIENSMSTSTATSSEAFSRTASATIIFNLALVDHLYNPSSKQAASLYELATSLLVGGEIDNLGIALINNIGVYYFENGDMNAAQRCMEHLSKIMPSCDCFEEGELRGLQTNIRWMLNPPFTVSPAA